MTATEQIAARVREIVGDLCPLGEREAQSDDEIIADLGYDSMAMVELSLVLESEFNLEPMDDDQAVDLVTVGDVEELVVQMVQTASRWTSAPRNVSG